MIPTRLADFDEAHARLAQPAGHQALAGETAGRSGLDSVGVEHRLRLARDVEQVRDFALHAEGQFKRLDHAVQLVRARRATAARSRFIAWIKSICFRCSERGRCALRFGIWPVSLIRVPWK